MPSFVRVIAFFSVTLIFPSLSNASDMENIMVSGVYMPQAKINTTAQVEIIEGDELQALNKNELSEVLRTISGVLVNQQGGMGGNIDVSMRGSEPNFIAVFIDGIQVNDPTSVRGNGFNFNSISIDSIHRIEIVKGPQSAIYGSDAVAGVIYIITHQATENPGYRLAVEKGKDDFYRIGLGASGTLGHFGYSLNIGQFDSGETESGGNYKSDTINTRFSLEGIESTHLELSMRYLDDEHAHYPEQSGGPAFSVLDQLEEGDSEEAGSSLFWLQEINSYWQSQMNVGYFKRKSHMYSPGISPFAEVPPMSDKAEYDNKSWRWVNQIGQQGKLWGNVGIDFRKETGKSEGYVDFGVLMPTGFDLERKNKGSFANVNWKFGSGWLLQLSTRYDDPDKRSHELTRQLGLKTPQLWSLLTVSANWGEGYKLPGFSALGHALVGNPDLKPETSESQDITFNVLLDHASSISLTYFENDYKNLIDFDSDQFKNVNRSHVETSGVEISSHWLMYKILTFDLYGTYTDIDVIDSSSKLTGRPKEVAGAIMGWQLGGNVELGMDYRYTGSRWAGSLHTGSSELTELSPYRTLDISIQWHANPWLSLKAAIDNAADETYYEAVGFPSQRRFFRIASEITL